MTLDPFTLEVIQEMLVSIVREMRTNLIRTAYSSFGAALSSLAQGVSEPRLTDFGGEKNAKSLYGLSRLCNGLGMICST